MPLPVWNGMPSATVTYSLPGPGIALSFNRLPPKMEFSLSQWIAEATAEISTLPDAVEVNSAIRESPQVNGRILSRPFRRLIRRAFDSQSEEAGLSDGFLHKE